MPERTDDLGDAVGEALQSLAHQLVVVAAQRVARDVGAFAVVQRRPGFVAVASVIQADRNHAHRAGMQFVRARAQLAVACHPVHRSVEPLREPVAQIRFVLAEFHAGDAAALETELARQFAHARRECAVVGRGVGQGGGEYGGVHGIASIESRDAP